LIIFILNLKFLSCGLFPPFPFFLSKKRPALASSPYGSVAAGNDYRMDGREKERF
jgi:hypothetical protein